MDARPETRYCFRCHHHPQRDDPALQRCGGCKVRYYCSQNCQRSDWSAHKDECRSLAATGQSSRGIRTTIRVGIRSLYSGNSWTAASDGQTGQHSGEVDPDLIFYVKIGKPHIHRIDVMGPFHDFATMISEMSACLRDEGAADCEMTLADMVADGSIMKCKHIQTPLADGTIIRMEIEKESNATVAGRMPCHTWHVISTTLMLDDENNLMYEEDGWRWQMAERRIVKTCLTLDEANAVCLQHIAILIAQAGGYAQFKPIELEGTLGGVVEPAVGSAGQAY